MKKVLVGLVFVSVNVCGTVLNSIDCELGNSKQRATMQQVPGSVPQAEGNTRYLTRRSERLQVQQAVQQSLEESRKRSSAEDNSPKSKRRKTNSNQSMQQNQIESSDLIQELENDEKDNENFLQQTDPEKWKKIKIFMGLQTQKQDKKRKYSSDHLRSALMYYCVHREVSVVEVADIFGFNYGTFRRYVSEAGILRRLRNRFDETQVEKMSRDRKRMGTIQAAIANNVSVHTICRNVKKRGEAPLRNYVGDREILEWYKNGGNFKDLYKIVTGGENNAKTKFADVISAQMSDEQKEQLVEKNMDIIVDFREGLLTDKGRINKYKNRSIRIGDVCERKFGECEDYLIRNIAHQLKYDLSKLSVRWDIEYESCKRINKRKRLKIINESNKGFLTEKGLAKKHQTDVSAIIKVRIWGKRRLRMNSKRPSQNSYKSVDFSNISLAKQQLEYLGYGEPMVREMISFVNQYNKLNSDQKNLFKTISGQNVADRRMPSDEELDEIKPIRYGDDKVNEKFRKLLLILCNKKNEIKMASRSINRLERELGIWKDLAQKEMPNDQRD